MVKKVFKTIIGITGLCVFCLTGCGVAPTAEMKDYVVVSSFGYDGYGSIVADIDYQKLVADYPDRLSKEMNAEMIGEQAALTAAAEAFELQDPFSLKYTSSETLKNGDVINMQWNVDEEGVEKLRDILNVKLNYEDFTYEIKDLTKMVEVDPFENYMLEKWGLDGEGVISAYSSIKLPLDDGTTMELYLDIENVDKTNWHNGETVKVKIKNAEELASGLAQQHGIILSQTEKEYVINGLGYYALDNPQLILDSLSQTAIDNATAACREWMKSDTEKRTVEYVGSKLYQKTKDQAKKSDFDDDNYLLMLFKVSNSKMPDGWYTYLSPTDDVIIGTEKADGVVLSEYATILASEASIGKDHFYYNKEQMATAFLDYPMTFEVDGVRYIGHTTIEDTITAFETNQLFDKVADYEIQLCDKALQEAEANRVAVEEAETAEE